MLYTSHSINGDWQMNFDCEPFVGNGNPWKGGCWIPNAVPGYWEDMLAQFRNAEFFSRLRFNPEYGAQAYPMAGSPPDTALPTISGTFLYRRTFSLPGTEGDWLLHFDGVQNSVWVWINDIFIGCHRGYSTPFDLTVPGGALQQDNTVVMAVSNLGLTGFDGQEVSGLTNRAVNQHTGGITGNVELRCYPTPLRDVSVVIQPDMKQADVRVESTAPIQITWQVWDDDVLLLQGDSWGDFSFDVSGSVRWCPEQPKLYTLCISCGNASVVRRFGVRRLRAEGTGLLLNNKPYYLRGVCEHCYYPLTVHPSGDAGYYRMVVRKFIELGFNFIRFHTHIPHEAYLQAADELGMLIQVESPNYADVEEYADIVRFCRRHPSVVIYCCGNELEMDEPFIDHLARCAQLVHTQTDALFSPMSALRGVEYFWQADKKDHHVTDIPFRRHPVRQQTLNTFCDLYNSYTLGRTSYGSLTGDPKLLDSWSVLYSKPRLSHETCIQGTYADLSLARRYGGTPMGRTQMFSSMEKALADKGLLEKAPLFFANSCQWQRRLRKHCFETTRLCHTLAGFDFLGPIDTHWHTFGYDVGMMNEFYEMKPGESLRDVRMYNSPTILLCNLGTDRNFKAGENLDISILTSHFGDSDLENAHLSVRLTLNGKCIHAERLTALRAKNGAITELYQGQVTLPKVSAPGAMQLYAQLECGDVWAENQWELYLFPDNPCDAVGLTVDPQSADELYEALAQGETVLMLNAECFSHLPTSFQIALAGRTAGNLATVIADHPALGAFPHEGYCGWQFRKLLEDGKAVTFTDGIPFDPIIEVASTPKNPIRQGILFEYRVGNGRLLVSGFCLDEKDAAASWLKNQLTAYVQSEKFSPAQQLTKEQLALLIGRQAPAQYADTNRAINLNDKAAIRKQHHVPARQGERSWKS